MKFADVTKHRELIGAEIDAAVGAVMSSGGFIMGPEVTGLEKELADFVGVEHCISCASGTDALLMPLLALGVGAGDAVFVPTFTFVATAEVVSLVGATPVFVDSGPDLNMDPASFEQAIGVAESVGLAPKVVIPVDIFGLPAKYVELTAIADRHGISVLADAAQSFGGTSENGNVGTLAPITATSFFPAKPLGCYGDGGAIFTSDASIAEALVSIRVHGKGSHKYENVRIGVNGRLNALQAAVLRPKLRLFPDEIRQRQAVAAAYVEGLGDLCQIPQRHAVHQSPWAQFTMLVDDRDGFIAALGESGVPTAIYYPTPLHMQPAFAGAALDGIHLSYAEGACGRAVSVPMHPYLAPAEISTVIDAVRAALS